LFCAGRGSTPEFVPVLRAIIFDFDGVLLDTEPAIMKVTQQVAALEGWMLSEADYYRELLPLDDRAMLERFGQLFGRPLAPARREELLAWKARAYREVIKDGLPPMPGAVEFVRQAIVRFPLAIASGSLRAEVEHLLEKAGLRHYFTVLVTASECERSKPHPQIYLATLEALKRLPQLAGQPLHAAECLAIEDAPGGVEAAHAAGMKCLALTCSCPATELAHADWVCRSFAEVDLAKIEAAF
jgi:HAD superfamily hydrolase (TIGR01509 family)